MYDIGEYIKSIEDLDYLQLINNIEQEISRSEEGTSNTKGAVRKRELGALTYASNLKGLAFFLKNGIKPFGIDDFVFESYKPIISKLVDKNQLPKGILEKFDK